MGEGTSKGEKREQIKMWRPNARKSVSQSSNQNGERNTIARSGVLAQDLESLNSLSGAKRVPEMTQEFQDHKT